jgi:ankyrin repeat protein
MIFLLFKALHCAASRGHLDCVKVLLDYCKVNIDVMDNNKCTPIFYSVTLGQIEVTEFLIRMKANLANQDCKGRT